MTDEEMAEEYADWYWGASPSAKRAIKDGYLAGLKAGRPKWHKVADGDLPKESIYVLIRSSDNSLNECIYLLDEGFKHPFFSTWYDPIAWIEEEKIISKE